MAHSRSHSQPVQYRYRPNAPTRSLTAVPAKLIQDAPPSLNYTMSLPATSPPCYGNLDMPLINPFTQTGPETAVDYSSSYHANFQSIGQPALDFTNSIHPLDYPPPSSSKASPWESSNSSVKSDSCSGAWSSPASSMSFSPEPTHQIPYMENPSWPPQTHNPYIGGDLVTMQGAFPQSLMDQDFGATPVFYSEMPHQWQCHYAGENMFPAFETTEYCSSHGSPESISDHRSGSSETVTTVKLRSDSLSTEAFPSPRSTLGMHETNSASPQPRAKSTQFQGQLLEFSTPVAQAKSKGPKFAALPCPLAAYGCTSSFISKNEWKRHINTQHLRLEAWLCDQCPKRDNKREFNRKDLFIQHLKRMHPPSCPTYPPKAAPKPKPSRAGTKNEKPSGKSSKGDDLDPELLEAEQRCHIILRQPPSESACLFCSTNFSGRGSWEARIEHVAKHMEQYKKEGNEVPDPKTWRSDRVLEQWLISEGVITRVRQRWSVA